MCTYYIYDRDAPHAPLYIHNTPTDSSLSPSHSLSLSLSILHRLLHVSYILRYMGIGQTDRHDQFHVIYMFRIKCRYGFFFYFFSHPLFIPHSLHTWLSRSFIRWFVTVCWTITHRSKCGYYIPTSLQLPIYINYTHT